MQACRADAACLQGPLALAPPLHAASSPPPQPRTPPRGSGLECNRPTDARVQDRIGYYVRYTQLLGTTPGDDLECYNQQPFGAVPSGSTGAPGGGAGAGDAGSPTGCAPADAACVCTTPAPRTGFYADQSASCTKARVNCSSSEEGSRTACAWLAAHAAGLTALASHPSLSIARSTTSAAAPAATTTATARPACCSPTPARPATGQVGARALRGWRTATRRRVGTDGSAKRQRRSRAVSPHPPPCRLLPVRHPAAKVQCQPEPPAPPPGTGGAGAGSGGSASEPVGTGVGRYLSRATWADMFRMINFPACTGANFYT